MKLLTVTVPCYNSQDYMEKCINSLLPGGDRVEIIIIDDGSKDNTGMIADEYARKYPDIVRVIHQENGGHGEGINQGIAHATGTYFKVVDSDDCVSGDFNAFLDELEACERQGGVDMVMTNYYYVHSDGIGDRSINFGNVLPEGRVFTWKDTKRFQIHQVISIHSTTFRTEAMRKWEQPLPKHTFYEDNLMIAQTLPFVERMYYMNVDLYRYTIGREGQSVQRDVLKKRYANQVLVSGRCFMTCHIDEIQEPRKKQYFKHMAFMMFAIAISVARLNKNKESDMVLEDMWAQCRAFDRKWANHYRYRTVLALLCIPGSFGRAISNGIYALANKVVRYN